MNIKAIEEKKKKVENGCQAEIFTQRGEQKQSQFLSHPISAYLSQNHGQPERTNPVCVSVSMEIRGRGRGGNSSITSRLSGYNDNSNNSYGDNNNQNYNNYNNNTQGGGGGYRGRGGRGGNRGRGGRGGGRGGGYNYDGDVQMNPNAK